jgi:hypothetical protein
VLDPSCSNNVLWFGIWQLDPIVKQIRGYPEYKFINACTSGFHILVWNSFFSFRKNASCNPVIILSSEDLSAEVNAVCATHDGQTFKRLLQQVGCLFSEVNASPVEHLGLFVKVWHRKLFLLGEQFLVLVWNQVIHLQGSE